MRVYLAGGMRTEWRRRVISAAPEHQYSDPCDHGLDEEQQYTFWDLLAIDGSDIVFVYFEASNPSGYGLSLEIGYAKGTGKPIILVDEKSASDESAACYLGMLRACADVCVQSLDEGLKVLSSLTLL